MRGGRELEVVQEDKHFSTHYQVSIGRPPFFPEERRGRGVEVRLQSFKGVDGSSKYEQEVKSGIKGQSRKEPIETV